MFVKEKSFPAVKDYVNTVQFFTETDKLLTEILC